MTRLGERSRRCVLAVPCAPLPAFASAQSRHGAQARRRVRARLLCAAALLRGAVLLCSLGAVAARRTPNVAPGARLCALPACARRRRGQTHASPRAGGPSSAGCARTARLGTFLELRGVPSRAAAAATTTSSRWSSSATAASERATCCPASPATSSASSPSRPSVSSSPRAASRHAKRKAAVRLLACPASATGALPAARVLPARSGAMPVWGPQLRAPLRPPLNLRSVFHHPRLTGRPLRHRFGTPPGRSGAFTRLQAVRQGVGGAVHNVPDARLPRPPQL